MKSHPLLAVLVSAVVAAGVWLFSAHFTGNPEPWDGSMSYYLGGLFVAGFVSALVTPSPMWGHYVGAWLGQVVYMFANGAGALIMVGILVAALYSLVALLGAVAALATRYALMPKRN